MSIQDDSDVVYFTEKGVDLYKAFPEMKAFAEASKYGYSWYDMTYRNVWLIKEYPVLPIVYTTEAALAEKRRIAAGLAAEVPDQLQVQVQEPIQEQVQEPIQEQVQVQVPQEQVQVQEPIQEQVQVQEQVPKQKHTSVPNKEERQQRRSEARRRGQVLVAAKAAAEQDRLIQEKVLAQLEQEVLKLQEKRRVAEAEAKAEAKQPLPTLDQEPISEVLEISIASDTSDPGELSEGSDISDEEAEAEAAGEAEAEPEPEPEPKKTTDKKNEYPLEKQDSKGVNTATFIVGALAVGLLASAVSYVLY